MADLERLLRRHTWFTAGSTQATFRNPCSLGDGWLEPYGVDAAIHEFHANWITGLPDLPSAHPWKEYGSRLAQVLHDCFEQGPP